MSGRARRLGRTMRTSAGGQTEQRHHADDDACDPVLMRCPLPLGLANGTSHGVSGQGPPARLTLRVGPGRGPVVGTSGVTASIIRSNSSSSPRRPSANGHHALQLGDAVIGTHDRSSRKSLRLAKRDQDKHDDEAADDTDHGAQRAEPRCAAHQGWHRLPCSRHPTRTADTSRNPASDRVSLIMQRPRSVVFSPCKTCVVAAGDGRSPYSGPWS